jgi:hypothetical protein
MPTVLIPSVPTLAYTLLGGWAKNPITECAAYTFTVKVSPSGQLYAACEPIGGK